MSANELLDEIQRLTSIILKLNEKLLNLHSDRIPKPEDVNRAPLYHPKHACMERMSVYKGRVLDLDGSRKY
jgi:hypothetical protein